MWVCLIFIYFCILFTQLPVCRHTILLKRILTLCKTEDKHTGLYMGIRIRSRYVWWYVNVRLFVHKYILDSVKWNTYITKDLHRNDKAFLFGIPGISILSTKYLLCVGKIFARLHTQFSTLYLWAAIVKNSSSCGVSKNFLKI